MNGIIIDEARILERAGEIAEEISRDFAGEEVLMVGILKGAVLWLCDVVKRVRTNVEIDFMAVSSYGAATKSSGVVRINKDLDVPIEGKNVIIVEDIVDSGVTLKYLVSHLMGRGPKCLRICTLLDKPTGRRVEIEADYVGFTAPDEFIVGYGLDFNQKYRNLPYITSLAEGDSG